MITSFLEADKAFSMDYHQRTLGHCGYESDFHSHLEFEIYYFHNGECNYFINDKIYRLKPGDMIVMHGLTLHRPNPNLHIPYDRTKIHFKPYFLESLINEFNAIDLYRPFRKLKNTRINLKQREDDIERIFMEIHQSYQNQGEALHDVKMQIYLLELLMLVYQSCAEQLVHQPSESTHNLNHKVTNVQKVIDFIEKHYREKSLTLSDISSATFLSKFYISRIFKEITGAGLNDYITIKKVNFAKQLLLNGKTVTEAALEVGYKHPAHFSRVFKQKVGMTADSYRKANEMM